jgi:glycosyltransferase involved in cell wall biosynthesis
MVPEKLPNLLRLPDKTPEELPDVSILIPANNEATGIADVVGRVRQAMDSLDYLYEILVIDDGSTDETAQNAHDAGAKVVKHPYNIGNGAAIKTGIRNARGRLLVTLDGDGQHPPEDIPQLLSELQDFDMVVGARTQNSATHMHRDMANRIYNWFASYVCGRRIKDLTSGFRAVKAHIAQEFISLLPNTFSYPTTITMATLRSGYSLKYIPITAPKRNGGSKSKIKLFRDGSRFFLIIFKVATLFSPMKIFLPISFTTFFLGLCYGLFKILFLDGRYGPTAAMLMTNAVIIFLIGLISEQITQLKLQAKGNASRQANISFSLNRRQVCEPHQN